MAKVTINRTRARRVQRAIYNINRLIPGGNHDLPEDPSDLEGDDAKMYEDLYQLSLSICIFWDALNERS